MRPTASSDANNSFEVPGAIPEPEGYTYVIITRDRLRTSSAATQALT